VSDPVGLGAYRNEVDEIDAALVELIARRLRIVDAVSAAKAVRAQPVRDPGREREVLDRVESAAIDLGVPGELVRRIFRELVSYAVDRQVADLLPGSATPVVVAFQGTEHTDNHLAARKFMVARRDEAATFVGHATYADAVASVIAGSCDLAVLPIESTAAGSINEVYDLLQRTGAAVVGEETWRLEHCLATVAEVPVSSITRVFSDARGLEQCSVLLRSLPEALPVACPDASQAMRLVSESADPTWAAIGPPESADAYGLVILRRRIAENLDSYVRFLVLARDPITVDRRIPSKTSIVLVTRHEDGALLRCLQILAASGRSMTKLESRPLPGRPFEYLFFLDFEGNVADPGTSAVLGELSSAALSVKVLGSYPAKVTSADARSGAAEGPTDAIEAVVLRHGTAPFDS